MMPIFLFRLRIACLTATVCLLTAACSPKLDWREVRDSNPSFSILMPAKPASLARSINLDGTQISMTMTAAEVDGVTYALGRARLASAEQAPAALQAMKTGLVRNINGTLRKEATLAGPFPTIEIEALGPARNGEPARLLAARFTARGNAVYQAVVLGPERAVQREALDTFFTSLKIDQQ